MSPPFRYGTVDGPILTRHPQTDSPLHRPQDMCYGSTLGTVGQFPPASCCFGVAAFSTFGLRRAIAPMLISRPYPMRCRNNFKAMPRMRPIPDLLGLCRVIDASCRTTADIERLLDFLQHQPPQPPAILSRLSETP